MAPIIGLPRPFRGNFRACYC